MCDALYTEGISESADLTKAVSISENECEVCPLLQIAPKWNGFFPGLDSTKFHENLAGSLFRNPVDIQTKTSKTT